MFKSKSSYVTFLEGMLVGGSLGAIATFVFGSEKGKKLQKEVLQKYHKFERRAKHYRDNVERAMKSPVAKKLKRLVKKTVKSKVARKSVRRVKRKSGRRKAAHR
jgi:gas vesicle protein